MVETRSHTEIHLIGTLTNNLNHDILPTTLEILKSYFYRHLIQEFSQKDSLKMIAHEIFNIWSQVDIPIMEEKNVVRKLHSVVSEYRDLGRSHKRGGSTQLKKENNFVTLISKLFDISKRNALGIMEDVNVKIFLEDQRANRHYRISTLRKILEVQEANEMTQFRLSSNKYKAEDKQKELSNEEVDGTLVNAFSQLSSSNGSCMSETTIDANEDCCSPETHYAKKRKCIKIVDSKILTHNVAMALDRANLSNAKAVHVLAAVATTSSTTTLDNVTLSVSTVRRERNKYRSKHATEDKAATSLKGPLVLHFDGKLLPSLAGNTSAKEDRIAFVVSGDKVDKLLGVPKIVSGKGNLIAEAGFSVISDWKLNDAIVGMSFDTTAANTGFKNGACVLLEQKMKKDLIWLPCRHHILEVVCKHVFTAVFGSSDGPNVTLFKRFKGFWPNINQQTYTACNDGRLNSTLSQNKRNTVLFILQTLNRAPERLPREDYRELLELTLIFLGEKPPRGVKFRAPGAFHHARWMAKLLYVFKIYIFRNQFELTLTERNSCLEFGLFASLVYVKPWTTCSRIVDAPYHDLQLVADIMSYNSTSNAISTAAFKAITRHLWYLGEELAAVCLFSDLINHKTKNKIARLLNENRSVPRNGRSLKYTGKANLSSKSIDFFIGPASHFIFEVLGLSTSFFSEDAKSWDNLDSYQKAKCAVSALNPVNDSAERGVALASEYNKSRTKSEDQYQYLLRMVESHRNRFPNAKKESIRQNL